ncbi:MAG: pyridoxal-phosphate dependent enzyme [Planctomycetota bacterium]
MGDFALTRHLPRLEVPYVSLGEYPTPIEHLPALGDVWLKREDLSSPIYGGNKIRTLETLFADAQAKGLKRVWTLGAYGSNQAVACILHARRVGLEPGAVLFPQRATPTGADNLRVTLSECEHVIALRSIATFPLHWWRLLREHGRSSYLVPPGGANPMGALGHAANALEIAEQVRTGLMPTPAHCVLAVGSTCTTAGLLVGLPLAQQLGLWPGELPKLHAVRVTPWPVTSRNQILKLARSTARYLQQIGGPRVDVDPKMLVLNTRHFGWGYARVTQSGLAAKQHFEELTAPPLDTTYAAKSGAALIELAKELPGPILFWCTKSSAPLPQVDAAKLANVPAFILRWLTRAQPNR